jgi:hypothetical protein
VGGRPLNEVLDVIGTSSMSFGFVSLSALAGAACALSKGLRAELNEEKSPWLGFQIFAVAAAAFWCVSLAFAGLSELRASDVLLADLGNRQSNQCVYAAWYFTGLAVALASFAKFAPRPRE